VNRILTSFVLVLAGTILLGAQSPEPAVYVDHETVRTAFAEGGGLASVPDARISVLRRTGPGRSEIHENETDIFYVVDGAATFITGGTLVDPEETGPGQIRGSAIEGGEVHDLVEGDIIAIPAGTPHWFSEVPESVNYLTVKALRH